MEVRNEYFRLPDVVKVEVIRLVIFKQTEFVQILTTSHKTVLPCTEYLPKYTYSKFGQPSEMSTIYYHKKENCLFFIQVRL